MKRKFYETPVMTESEMLAEQTFLQGSAGVLMDFGEEDLAGAGLGSQSWGEF